jgi:ATP-dependent Clp protease ATP-binding subunit ClpA
MQLEEQLSDRNVSIELNDEACKWLIDRGYDKTFGARPLARIIQEHIKKPLAEELLFGKLVKGGTVSVSVQEGELVFDYKPIRPLAKNSKPKATELVR